MKKIMGSLAALTLAAVLAQPAVALPILGGQLFYSGGDVTVTSLPVSSAFTSELGLYNASFSRLLNIMNDEPSGTTVTFNPGTLFGFLSGQELIFGISILDTGDEFFMGAATRNPDDIAHATVDDQGSSIIVGFEDLLGGGDLDFDDNRFSFTAGVVDHPVPEPTTTGLLGLALLPLGFLSRKRARAR